MNARIVSKNRLGNRQKKAIVEYANEHFKKEQSDYMRKLFKIMCVALNELYGFGGKRLAPLIQKISDVCEEYQHDEIYWHHVDRIVIDEMGIEFDREKYEG